MVGAHFKQKFQVAEQQRVSGDYEGALRSYDECLALLDKATAPRAYAVTKFRMARLARAKGSIEDAASTLGCLAHDEELPGEIQVEAAESLVRLLMDHPACGNIRMSIDLAMELAEQQGAQSSKARLHGNLGVLALREGDWVAAKQSLLISADIFGAASDPGGQAQAWTALGEVVLRAGRPGDAMGYFEDSFRLSLKHEAFELAAVPRAAMGHILRRRGQSRDALKVFQEVCQVLQQGGEHTAGASLDLATALMDLGDWPGAGAALDRAMEHAATDLARARSHYSRADWFCERGLISEGLKEVVRAQDLFSAAEDRRGVEAARAMMIRLEWRLGRKQVLPVEPPGHLATPELKVAYQAQMAERFFNADQVEEALALAHSFSRDEIVGEGEDRVRELKAEAYINFLNWVAGKRDLDDFMHAALRIVNDLGSRGNIREAVAMAMSPAPLLIFKMALPQAAQLLGVVGSMQVERWPLGWRRAYQRCNRMLALASGVEAEDVEVGELPEGLTAQIFEGVVRALESGQREALESCLLRFDESGRNIWARLIRGFLVKNPKVFEI